MGIIIIFGRDIPTKILEVEDINKLAVIFLRKKMSRRQFIKESMKHSEWRMKNNLPVHIDIYNVDKYIRDKWITENRHDELIAYILDEWDNGDFNDYTDFIEEYEALLLKENLSEIFIKLWSGILNLRLKSFRWWYKKSVAKKENPSWIKITIEKKNYVLKAIDRFTNGLLELNEFKEIEKIQSLKSEIEIIEIPASANL